MQRRWENQPAEAKDCSASARGKGMKALLVLLLGASALLMAACGPLTIGQKASPPEPQVAARAHVPDSEEMLMREDCLSCHLKEGQIVKETNPLPAIPHKVEGWEQCTFCHADRSLAPMPSSHEGMTEDLCQACHAPSSAPPPQMTHDTLEGRSCSSCHGTSLALPASHSQRDELTCRLCHEVSEESPPFAPHSLVPGSSCSDCHKVGQLIALPLSHAGRGDELCTICHQEQPGGVPAIPHTLENRSDCTYCHFSGSP